MYDSTARIHRCTTLKATGHFCDQPSVEDVPFPICARHAVSLFRHMQGLTDAEVEALRPTPPSRPHVSPKTRRERNKAIKSLLPHGASVVYAVQFPDGIIKIGCTANLPKRLSFYANQDGALIGFMLGELADEQAIHASLREHLARGREWYNPTPAVMSAVNDMREHFNMPHIAA